MTNAGLKKFQNNKKLFWYLLMAIDVAVSTYAYFVNQAVYAVAEREKIETKISALNSKLGEIEFKYIALKNEISPEYAYSLGFHDVKNQNFISKKDNADELSLKTGR